MTDIIILRYGNVENSEKKSFTHYRNEKKCFRLGRSFLKVLVVGILTNNSSVRYQVYLVIGAYSWLYELLQFSWRILNLEILYLYILSFIMSVIGFFFFRNNIFPSTQASGNYIVAVLVAIASFIISELLTGLEEWTTYTPKFKVDRIWFSAFWLYNLWWVYQYLTSNIIFSQVSLFLLLLNWIINVSLDSGQYKKIMLLRCSCLFYSYHQLKRKNLKIYLMVCQSENGKKWRAFIAGRKSTSIYEKTIN